MDGFFEALRVHVVESPSMVCLVVMLGGRRDAGVVVELATVDPCWLLAVALA